VIAHHTQSAYPHMHCCQTTSFISGREVRLPEQLDSTGFHTDVLSHLRRSLFRALQTRRGLTDGDDSILDALFPPGRVAPLVTVLDSHPHTLTFIGAIGGVRVTSLEVTNFSQSGDVDDLYHHFQINHYTIIGAALDLLGCEATSDRAGALSSPFANPPRPSSDVSAFTTVSLETISGCARRGAR
jgi:hypothetical protein